MLFHTNIELYSESWITAAKEGIEAPMIAMLAPQEDQRVRLRINATISKNANSQSDEDTGSGVTKAPMSALIKNGMMRIESSLARRRSASVFSAGEGETRLLNSDAGPVSLNLMLCYCEISA